MLNRSSVLLLALGLAGGYAITGSAVTAQVEPIPFAVGDRLSLRFGAEARNAYVGDSEECVVLEIHGAYFKCGPTVRRAGVDPTESWVNVRYAVQIIRREGR